MTKQSAVKLGNGIGEPGSILVATKYRFIGDTLLAVPLLRAVSQRWPRARISLLTGAKARELLMHCPYLHEVIEFDPYRRCDQGWGSYFALVKALRQRRFDAAFVCNRSFHSALTATLSGASRRIGWSGFEMRDALLTCTTPYDPDAPEVESYLDLLRSVAPDAAPSAHVELWVTSEERARVAGRIPRAQQLIGIQPGATHDEKRWPPERFGALAQGLLQRYPGAEFMLVGGPDERGVAEAMLSACDETVRRATTSLVGDLCLRETLALLTYLDLFIAGDTAIRHAAMAVDTPSVALFGPTSIRKWGNARPPRHIALGARDGKVAGIDVDTVLDACLAALGDAERAQVERAERRDEVQV